MIHFFYLSNIFSTAIEYAWFICIAGGDKKTYGVAYNFKSTSLNHYLEIRIEVTDEQSIHSISDLWGAADWHEREAYDMMGIY